MLNSPSTIRKPRTPKWRNTSRSRTYLAWRNLRSRCLNPNNASFKHYGARGISVCAEWLNDFDQFFEDMGEAPEGLTLERIDNELGYSPTNCVWASVRDQLNNQRRNVRVTHQGLTLTIAQWASKLGVEYDTLWRRFRRSNMEPAKALTTSNLSATGWSHGTRTGYEYGCRCPECTAFNTMRCRGQRAAKK